MFRFQSFRPFPKKIGSTSRSAFKANARRLNTPASAHGGQEGREDGHTDRSEKQGEGLARHVAGEDAKQRRVEPRLRCRGKAHDRDASKGAPWERRSAFSKGCQPGPHG